MQSERLAQQLGTLPANPGIYLFRDKNDKVIYVGKAASLSSRVRSYFGAPRSLSSKAQRLASSISTMEFIITNSEAEALLLECNMIKKYHPRFNVRFRDDKAFPYLKIDTNEDWPAVRVTRRRQADGATYFGPFASAGSVRKTRNLIKRIFPLRSCNKRIDGRDRRPCLDYHIHRCLGPCIGAVSKEGYRDVVNQVISFLQGKQELVVRELHDNMEAAVQKLQFEKAALFRDQIRAIEDVIEGQRIAVASEGEQDVVALAQQEGLACVQVFFIRNDKLIDRQHFVMHGVYSEDPIQTMTGFLKQYYTSTAHIPPAILLQYPADDLPLLRGWLKNLRGGHVRLQVPRRGVKRRLVEMAAENAKKALDLVTTEQRLEDVNAGLEDLKAKLCLRRIPTRMEGYDISNIQGTLAVGSMVVFENGLPKTRDYRRFRIKAVHYANDYAMLQEMLRRRFKRGICDKGSWAANPDLVLIDGGKGHLNAALEVRHEVAVDSIPIVSLAKENEEVFLPGRPDPVDMAVDSAGLHLLQRIRDEAHRFAVSYHRKLRRKHALASALDTVPGIGPKRKRALLSRFGSVQAISAASEEELGRTKGITAALAGKVKQYL